MSVDINEYKVRKARITEAGTSEQDFETLFEFFCDWELSLMEAITTRLPPWAVREIAEGIRENVMEVEPPF